VLVIAACLDIFFETPEFQAVVTPFRTLRTPRIVVEVVIEDHRRTAIHATGSAAHDSPMFAYVNDVVLKYIVAQIELHEDLASSRFPSVIVVQGIVDDGCVLGLAPL
jgi:hypothetical protein